MIKSSSSFSKSCRELLDLFTAWSLSLWESFFSFRNVPRWIATHSLHLFLEFSFSSFRFLGLSSLFSGTIFERFSFRTPSLYKFSSSLLIVLGFLNLLFQTSLCFLDTRLLYHRTSLREFFLFSDNQAIKLQVLTLSLWDTFRFLAYCIWPLAPPLPTFKSLREFFLFTNSGPLSFSRLIKFCWAYRILISDTSGTLSFYFLQGFLSSSRLWPMVKSLFTAISSSLFASFDSVSCDLFSSYSFSAYLVLFLERSSPTSKFLQVSSRILSVFWASEYWVFYFQLDLFIIFLLSTGSIIYLSVSCLKWFSLPQESLIFQTCFLLWRSRGVYHAVLLPLFLFSSIFCNFLRKNASAPRNCPSQLPVATCEHKCQRK